MINIIFLVSGNGGNLKFIKKISHIAITLNINVIAVISDRECGALDYCRRNNIENYLIKYSQNNFIELQSILDFYNADFIVTNWHKIIDSNTVKRYENKFINLHYSLLPAFGALIGNKPVKSALSKGCRFIGTTVHFVNEIVDDGAIIGQTIVDVEDLSQKGHDLMNKIFRDGAINLLNSILEIKISQPNSSKYYDTDVVISPKLNFDSRFLSEQFWLNLDKVDG